MKISDIEARLSEMTNPSDPFVQKLRRDERKGAQKALEKWMRKLEKEREQLEKFREMSRFEDALRRHGCRLIAGIDEAGRGPLAGPVVAACVILPEDFCLPGLNDSKQLSEKQREAFFAHIQEEALVGVGFASAEEIDRMNVYEAAKKAMLAALGHLPASPDHLLIDAMEIPAPYPQTSIVKGDAKSISIAAASVIAKVTRDRYMREMDEKYPGYGFAIHKGYGTKKHLEAIMKLGPCPIHRKSFAPIKDRPAIRR
ncbi:ribonuclease HII [Heyndrickxia coagulans]|uniref:ribonuclease HII n=1 Tax=Heyndrickxia TaxID=2837504 RepID=UPI0039906CF1